MANRDDFPEKTKQLLAQRVGNRCSFPNCNILTKGPKSGSSSEVSNIGIAAHISAASKGGPRYNPQMTTKERKSIENGIWMCSNHATLIDRDYRNFSEETLKTWKISAEEKTHKELSGTINNQQSLETITTLQIGNNIVCYVYWSSIMSNNWSFSLVDFQVGTLSDLKDYILDFNNLDHYQCFAILDTEGDARKLKSIAMDSNNSIKLSVENKENTTDYHEVGTSLKISDTGDLVLIEGNIAMVSGKEAAIQRIREVLGVVPKEIKNSSLGSAVHNYYKLYKNNNLLLSKLIKLELIKHALIPLKIDENNYNRPLSFIKKIHDAYIPSTILDEYSNLTINIDIEFYDTTRWHGELSLYIYIDE